jgi:hypothetical protein
MHKTRLWGEGCLRTKKPQRSQRETRFRSLRRLRSLAREPAIDPRDRALEQDFAIDVRLFVAGHFHASRFNSNFWLLPGLLHCVLPPAGTALLRGLQNNSILRLSARS